MDVWVVEWGVEMGVGGREGVGGLRATTKWNSTKQSEQQEKLNSTDRKNALQ
jgi:hypothetical protein